MKKIFSEADLQQIEQRGVTLDIALHQVDLLRNPPPPILLVRPCTAGDGIRVSEAEKEELISAARRVAASARVMKFVPASGAATRMFRDLSAAAANTNAAPRSFEPVRLFLTRLDDFPFAAELRARANICGNSPEDDRAILLTLLREMNYASRPKGLIPFHRDGERVRTPFEEQLIEACAFARSDDGACRVQFTTATQALLDFQTELGRVESSLRDAGCNPRVDFSEQHPSTDTLALDAEGELFRESDGSLLFRPGGHGALIRNLEQLNGDIVSIKNIDNVLPAAMQAESVEWKLILIGVLARLQDEVFEAIRRCGSPAASETDVADALALAAERFNRRPPQGAVTLNERKAFVLDALNRPMRVCGVVKNEGEPGGAPFWVAEEQGGESVQIVESSQVRMDDAHQQKIWSSSTHFNPVDIVCGLRNWNGEPFDLSPFIDQRAVFVSRKSHEGRELRALELPGLWNGAMAGWNTVCVEVPASTFAPVKTVLDLLRSQHQTTS
ncbi:MAG TPA: DUF4301 family protein [Thermoanaerobaculia bacterium]|nr:DUF4301 family protein [Thermoanaerobaculia bacterium]